MKIRWTTLDVHGKVFAVQRSALQNRAQDLLRRLTCRMALEHLKLDQLTLVCPGEAAHELREKVRVRGLSRVLSEGKL